MSKHTYVISDIHGNFDKFQQLLDKIQFSNNDDLFLLGDLVDRGHQNMALLQFTMAQPNIYPLLGNHDYMALMNLDWLHPADNDQAVQDFAELDQPGNEAALQETAAKMVGLTEWQEVGGKTTLAEFRQLPPDQQDDILEYLGEFSLYESLTVSGRRFILVHAGLQHFAPQRPLADYQLDELIFTKPDYARQYFDDIYLVTGHTPTRLIRQPGLRQFDSAASYDDRIYQAHNHIAIDCGCGYGGRLGAFCLDNMTAFYI